MCLNVILPKYDFNATIIQHLYCKRNVNMILF
nr:MAG TPA: hypothetical protein [Caudoviricetes sp.]